jgi:hypothetical protein
LGGERLCLGPQLELPEKAIRIAVCSSFFAMMIWAGRVGSVIRDIIGIHPCSSIKGFGHGFFGRLETLQADV